MKAGWRVVPLGEVCTVSKKQGGSRPLPYVGLEDIASGGVGLFLGNLDPQTDKSTTFEFEPVHVLYGRLRPYLNKVLLPDFVGHCSSEIFPLLPLPQLDRRFLFHWLTSQQTVDAINATCTGARMPRANVSELMTFPIPLPPLAEQKRIVAVLDEAFEGLSRARANAEANLAGARELFECLREEVLRPDVSGWTKRNLADCFRLKSGDNLTSKEMVAGSFPVYGGNGIAGTHNQSNLSGENVIIGRVGALCGNARFIDHDIWLTDNAFKIADYRLPFDRQFLSHLLNFKNLRSLARQTAQPVISNSSLAELELDFPVATETQREIARKLSDAQTEIDGLESHYQGKLQTLDTLLQSLLQKAFSGELT